MTTGGRFGVRTCKLLLLCPAMHVERLSMTDLLAAGSVLGPARRRVLADEVADAIRDAIFAGRIDLGQRLVEEELATNLNVSRAPVREALGPALARRARAHRAPSGGHGGPTRP